MSLLIKDGELKEHLEFENIAGGKINISEAFGVLSESLKEQFNKK